jgi:formylglycine-generating enzyme required for sulfatase activity
MRKTWLLIAVFVTAVGCAKDGTSPASTGDDKVIALPTLSPPSGGELVLIPAGSFTMGDAAGRPDETPHSVSLRSFYLDKYPVTQELYEKIMGANPSKRKGKQSPVERTQWTDAVRFCNRCSELEGLTPCYNLTTWECNFEADGYRLPTEAEWEYACRAGSAGRYCFGDDEGELARFAWYKPGSGGTTRPVGEKAPNRWGLFDVHGNVWQWCNDYYDESYYQSSPSQDPRGPAGGKMRVLRGGAWDCTPDKCRAAYRHKEFPVYSDACFGADSYGFRRARAASVSGKNTSVAAARVPRPAVAPEKPLPPAETKKGTGAIAREQLHGTIVFVSDRSGTLKIWRMHANGKDLKRLTHDANPDADPRFAPDGKHILYTTLRAGFPEIWIMNADGSQARSVTKGSQGSWSPDGKSLVFIRDNQAYVRELTGDNERRLTPASWERCGVPAWSPDGKRFAVASRHLGTVGIFILSVDGKENHPLKTEEQCCTPRWSRNGKRILCQSVQGHIHQVDSDGSNGEQVTFGADVQHDACYSPDGSMILFCRAPTPEGPWQLCVKRLDSEDEDFATLTQQGSNLLPDWHAQE